MPCPNPDNLAWPSLPPALANLPSAVPAGENDAGGSDAQWIVVEREIDIASASRIARTAAEHLGFSRTAAYQIATAAAELASNLLLHAGGGQLGVITRPAPPAVGARLELELCAFDQGPGIADLALALTEGYSTGGGLGCGLPGVRRLMDQFVIESNPGQGTSVKAVKWL